LVYIIPIVNSLSKESEDPRKGKRSASQIAKGVVRLARSLGLRRSHRQKRGA
jgi:hypothetical protein